MDRPPGRRRHGLIVLAVIALIGLAGVPSTALGASGPATTGHELRLDAWPTDAPPNDPLYAGYQADLGAMGIPGAWTRTVGAADVIIAVLDTGLDTGNAEFAGRLVPGYNAITNQTVAASGWGVVADGNGHGTHVTGTAAAATQNGYGIAGIAPGARIMPIKVMPDSGSGDFADLVEGLDWAVAHGADVINISLSASSLGSMGGIYGARFTAAVNDGVVVVASSGNDGATQSNYPCGFASVICVASTTKSGSAVSTFSTRTTNVDVAAPGESIVSTIPGGSFSSANGTSMAAPHVAGTVALMRSVSSLAPAEIRSILTNTAVDLAPAGFDTAAGHGRVDADAAVATAAAATASGFRPRVGVLVIGNPGFVGQASPSALTVAAAPPWDAPKVASEIEREIEPNAVTPTSAPAAPPANAIRVRVEPAIPSPRRMPTAVDPESGEAPVTWSSDLAGCAGTLVEATIPIGHLVGRG